MNGIARDIPVLLSHECSKSLPNAIIESTIIWILASKLYFSCAGAAAGLFSRLSRHRRALARASFGRASLHVRRRRRRGSLLGVGTITPGCCRSLGWFRLSGVSRRRSLGELRSFAGASFSRQTATSRLPRCTFQTHEVLVEISQHQSNIIVKAARGAGDLLSPAAASKFTLIFFFTA